MRIQTKQTQEIARVIEKFYELPEGMTNIRTNQRKVVFPRQLTCYLAHKFIKSASLQDIGDAFDGSRENDRHGIDHCTVIHARKAIKNLLDTDKQFRMEYKIIEARVRKLFKTKRHSTLIFQVSDLRRIKSNCNLRIAINCLIYNLSNNEFIIKDGDIIFNS